MVKKTSWEKDDARPLQSGGHFYHDATAQRVVIFEAGMPKLVERGSKTHQEFLQRQLAQAATSEDTPEIGE